MRGFLNSKANIKVDPNEPGLVCGLDMKQDIAGTVSDKSGNGNDGTLVGNPRQGSCLLGDYLSFDGSADYLDLTGLSLALGPMSFLFNVDISETDTTTRYLFDSLTGRLGIAWRTSTAGKIGVFDGSTWQDIADGPSLNAYHSLLFVFDGVGTVTLYTDGELAGTSSYTPVAIGGNTSLMTNHAAASVYSTEGKLYNFALYSEAKDQNFAREQYALGKTALFQTLPVNNTGTVTSGQIGDSPFRVDSGSYKVNDDAEAGKVLENITNGACDMPTSLFQQTPTEAMVGTWEFSVYKTGVLSNLVVVIGNNIPGGAASGQNYNFIFRNDETMDLRRVGTVLLAGSTVFNLDTWYRIKITRSASGEFELFVDEESQGTATDTTYSTADYFGIDIDAGDKVALGSLNGNHSIIKRLLS